MTDESRVDLGTAALARPLLDPICELYDEVFSAPPSHWRDEESELHRGRLLRLLDDPTFGITVAWVGEEPVGFAYGYTVPVDTKRWLRLVEPLPEEMTAELPGRTFMLFDFAVRASYRGRGIGRALHHGLLASRSEERATLSVEPDVTGTKRIYEHWGWRQIGQSIGTPGESSPMFDVYLRDRLDDLTLSGAYRDPRYGPFVTDESRIDLGNAALARPLLDPICALYDEVFSAPPFFWREDESQLHRERLVGLLDDPTFGITVARVGQELAGFAYGFGLPADTKRWSRLTEPLSVQATTEWPGRTFLLFDYAVAVPYRGRGIGRKLHDGLLGSRREERATLTVQPTALDTKGIYEHWGWHRAGQMEGGPTAAAPLFDVYLRDRLDDLRTAAQAAP
ncbi:MAG: hypothetical protein AUI14_21430 [Actinobacteria bacterium 13_2_20CM_2_71_6]|nr:MAG: hypothetical protein AUI14_21430 [Actinobacteria bacterium 13_2_20CM_2_71_6]